MQNWYILLAYFWYILSCYNHRYLIAWILVIHTFQLFEWTLMGIFKKKLIYKKKLLKIIDLKKENENFIENIAKRNNEVVFRSFNLKFWLFVSCSFLKSALVLFYNSYLLCSYFLPYKGHFFLLLSWNVSKSFRKLPFLAIIRS